MIIPSIRLVRFLLVPPPLLRDESIPSQDAQINTGADTNSIQKGTERDSYYNSYRGPSKYSDQANSVPGKPTSFNSFIDPYSYNGALSSKGGDFMAVNSDFSKFGR